MGVYEDLATAKANGNVLTLKDLSLEDLRSMFVDEHILDSMIAELYDVPKSRISYLRRKHGITLYSATEK